MVALPESSVNPFAQGLYQVISLYEQGSIDFTPEVEHAYLCMLAAFEFYQPCPEDVPLEWWLAHARDWWLEGYAQVERASRFWQSGAV